MPPESGESSGPRHERSSTARRLGAVAARRPGATVLALAVLAALTSWMLSASLYGGKVLSGNDQLFFQSPFSSYKPAGLLRASNPYTFDAVYVFHPGMQLARSLIRSGSLPLWNPYEQAGRPLLASQQSAPLYPLTFLAYLLPFWQSLAWIAALKLMLAGFGTFVFARSLRLRAAPALLAAVSYAFGSYFVLWLEHPHTNVYLLLPWLLWLSDGTLLRGGPRWAAGLALGVGLAMLGGHPQSAVIVLVAVGAYGLFRLLAAGAPHVDERGGVPRELRLRRAGLFAGALMVGLAAGAVMLLPFLEAITQGEKLSRAEPSLVRKAAATLVFPDYWGRADRSVAGGGPPLIEGMMYTGAVALLLSVSGLVLRRTRTQLFFVVLGVLALLTVINLGPVDDVARKIPVLASANLDRAIILMTFAIAMLGAYGLDGLMAPRRGKGRAVAATAAAALAPFAWFIRQGGVSSDLGGALHQIVTTGFFPAQAADVVRLAAGLRWLVLAALIILAAVALWRGRAVAAVAALLVALAGVDLVPLTRGYHPAIPLAWADPPPPPTITRLQQLQGADHVIGEGGLLGPDLPVRYRLNDVRGHDLPAMRRYLDLYFALGGGVGGSSGQRTEYNVNPAGRRLLDVFGVRYAAAPGLVGTPGTRVVFHQGGVPAILEDEAALPRAWVAYGWQPTANEKQSLDTTYRTSAVDLERTPVIEGAPSSGGDRTAPPTPARVALSGVQRVVIRANAARPGWLILNDTYYPGWHASVDGRGVEIRPANTAFRAVPIPAGRHTVTFVYRPLSVIVGAVLSALAFLAIALGLIWPAIARRRSPARR